MPSGGSGHYGASGGVGTAGSKKSKEFARLIDESLLEPQPKRTKRDREKAAEIERLLRTLPVLPRGATASVAPILSKARVPRIRASGGAVASAMCLVSAAFVQPMYGTGAASAGTLPVFSATMVVLVMAGGIHNPTDEELSHIADQLHQAQQVT